MYKDLNINCLSFLSLTVKEAIDNWRTQKIQKHVIFTHICGEVMLN